MTDQPMKTVGGKNRGKVSATDPLDEIADQVAAANQAETTFDWEVSDELAAATNTAVMPKGGGELEWITMDGIQMNPKLAAELLLRKHGIKGVQLLTSDDLYASIGQIMNDRVAGIADVGERVVLERLSQEFSG